MFSSPRPAEIISSLRSRLGASISESAWRTISEASLSCAFESPDRFIAPAELSADCAIWWTTR
jgi:hypothetical protein